MVGERRKGLGRDPSRGGEGEKERNEEMEEHLEGRADFFEVLGR